MEAVSSMEEHRPLLDFNTAKAFAAVLLRNESEHLNDGDFYAIDGSRSIAHPWGWEFQPVIEPYWSNKQECPYEVKWNVTVDRFSGKVLKISDCSIENEDYPIMELTLHEIGKNKNVVFILIRQVTGWNSAEVFSKLKTLPVVLTSGPLFTLRSMHEVFVSRGAKTSLKTIQN